MAVTQIKNNQITDALSGNTQVGINAGAKVQDYSITSTKLANNITYGSNLSVTGNLGVASNVIVGGLTITPGQSIVGTIANANITLRPNSSGVVRVTNTGSSSTLVIDNTSANVRNLVRIDTTGSGLGSNGGGVFQGTYILGNGTATQSQNRLAALIGSGSENGNNVRSLAAARVTLDAAADWSTGSTPAHISMWTTASGSNVATETVRAESGGNLTVFAGSLNAANGNVNTGTVNATGAVIAQGNVAGNYILGNGALLTGVITSVANINNGTSNVAIGSANANVTVGVSGVGNVAVFSPVGASVAGTLQASGSITGGNLLTSGSITATSNVTAGNVNTAVIRNTGALTVGTAAGNLNLTPAGNVVLNNTYINGVQLNPVQDQDVASKYYVDVMSSTGLSFHQPVVAATVSNSAVTTGGTTTYTQPNGVSNGVGAYITTTGSWNLVDTSNVQTANTRILIKNEANAVWNGVYYWANASTVIRTTDTDEYGPDSTQALSLNDYFFVTNGNVNAGSAYVVSAPTGTITFGSSNIAFAQFSSSQTYTAGNGVVISGTVISAKTDNVTTAFDGTGNIIVKASAQLTTPNIGAATGTSVSVVGTVTANTVLTGQLTANGTVNFTNSSNVSLGYVDNVAIAGGVSGQILQTDGAGNLQWVDNTPTTVTYLANSISQTGGVYVSGDLYSIQVFGDYNEPDGVYILTDGTGQAPAWIFTVGYSNVVNFNQVQMNINYTAASNHTIYVQLYNYATSFTLPANTVTTSSVGNLVTVSSTANMYVGQTLLFGTSVGGLVPGTNYYVLSIPNSTQVTVGIGTANTSVVALSNASVTTTVSAQNYDNIGTYTGLGYYYAFALDVIDSTNYISNGNTILRLFHSNAGNATHTTDIDYVALVLSNQGPQGPKGQTGAQGTTGPGVATGGTTGQVLIKNSSANYDTGWSSSLTNLTTVSASGNIAGNYILGNGALLTGVITSVANINNGTSNVAIGSANANVTVGVNGASNVAVFAPGAVSVDGVFTTPKNISANITVPANVNALLFGPTTTSPGVNITVPSSSTLFVYGNSGIDNGSLTANINGQGFGIGNVSYLSSSANITATGNVIAGNLVSNGRVTAVGNVIAAGFQYANGAPVSGAGSQGTTGTQGATGTAGAQGTTGAGTQGTTGTAGAQGTVGTTGAQGTTGTAGAQGTTGIQGVTGAQGTIGFGAQGTAGVSGVQGPTGVQGTDGAQGTTGSGAQGTTGAQGTAGTVFDGGIVTNTTTFTANAQVFVQNTTPSTSTTIGALVVTGGIASGNTIAGNVVAVPYGTSQAVTDIQRIILAQALIA